MANSEDPDQTSPSGADLGLHCPFCKKLCVQNFRTFTVVWSILYMHMVWLEISNLQWFWKCFFFIALQIRMVSRKIFYFSMKINCGYSLEVHQRGISNKHPSTYSFFFKEKLEKYQYSLFEKVPHLERFFQEAGSHKKYASYGIFTCDFTLSTLDKISVDDSFKIFFLFSPANRIDNTCKLSPMETICMKCQILFSEKNKKNIINMSSAEFSQTGVKINMTKYQIADRNNTPSCSGKKQLKI